MKKIIVNYGGIILFYLFLILCIVLLNARFSYLNSNVSKNYSYSYNN